MNCAKNSQPSFILKQGLVEPGGAQTSGPPAPTSQVVGLQACTTTPPLNIFLSEEFQLMLWDQANSVQYLLNKIEVDKKFKIKNDQPGEVLSFRHLMNSIQLGRERKKEKN